MSWNCIAWAYICLSVTHLIRHYGLLFYSWSRSIIQTKWRVLQVSKIRRVHEPHKSPSAVSNYVWTNKGDYDSSGLTIKWRAVINSERSGKGRRRHPSGCPQTQWHLAGVYSVAISTYKERTMRGSPGRQRKPLVRSSLDVKVMVGELVASHESHPPWWSPQRNKM